MLNGIIPVEADIQEDVKEHFTSVWASSISDYLRLSIQKWYAPKIHNRELNNFCKNKWLLVSVDNKPIRKQDLLPFFRLVQELYTTALAKTYSYAYVSREFQQIETLPIKIMNYFENGLIAGYVSMIKISKSELNGDQILLSPYDYIGKFEADGGLNEPVMMYARDPGMVIDYPITGAWVKNLPLPESPEEYLFAFFVPVTNRTIKNGFAVPEYAGMKLGEYLRECEASDHMGWNDPVKMQIVQRIQKNAINQINKQIKASTVTNVDATASKLSNRLGRNLLPKIGYGKKRDSGGSGGGGGGGTKITNIVFEITSQTIKENEINLDFCIKLSHGKKNATLSLMIASEAGWIDAASWNDDIGTDFPVVISECYFDTVETPISENPYEIQQTCAKNSESIDTDVINVQLLSETTKNLKTQLKIMPHVQNPKIIGKMRLNCQDKKYQFIFRVD